MEPWGGDEARRLFPTPRWIAIFETAPPVVAQTISNMMEMLLENPFPDPDCIMDVKPGKGLADDGIYTAVLGDVMLTFMVGEDPPHHVALLLLFWDD